jgi:tetratricopeptide (TPR) repeat protein
MRHIVVILFVGIILLLGTTLHAQPVWSNPELESQYNKANESLKRGDFKEAILGFQSVISQDPLNEWGRIGLVKALGYDKQSDRAIKMAQPLFDKNQATEEIYIIIAKSYLNKKDFKKTEKIFNEGIAKYPHSGRLYFELGNYYTSIAQGEKALSTWIDGIHADPTLQHNYFEAAYAYMHTYEPLWAMVYAEVFLNYESQTVRANDARQVLIDAYKKFFFNTSVQRLQIEPGSATNFIDAVNDTYARLSGLLADGGINLENLVVLRTRFIMDWKKYYAQKFPFALFDYLDKMIAEGHYEAYNYTLFGSKLDEANYQKWQKVNFTILNAYQLWKKNNPLKMSASDNYNPKMVKNIFKTGKKR